MAFLIDPFLYFISAVTLGQGLWILINPSSYFSLILTSGTATVLSKSPFIFTFLTPFLSSFLIIIGSIAFYATTFPSLHSKVKVARSLLVGKAILLYLSINEAINHNKMIFQPPLTFHLYFTAPIAVGFLWAILNSIGGEEEHSKLNVKKAK